MKNNGVGGRDGFQTVGRTGFRQEDGELISCIGQSCVDAAGRGGVVGADDGDGEMW